MGNLDMLKKQHEEVLTLVKTISGMIADSPEEKSKEIAFNINACIEKIPLFFICEYKGLIRTLKTYIMDNVLKIFNAIVLHSSKDF